MVRRELSDLYRNFITISAIVCLLCMVAVMLMEGTPMLGIQEQKNVQNATSVAIKRCLSCALNRMDLENIGGIIAETNYFRAAQDYAVPIPGFVIIASKRHIHSIDEFTPQERIDFIEFIYEMRKRMRDRLGIETVYLVQEEDASHFHLWLFPRYDWMIQIGEKIKSVKPIMQWAKEHLNMPDNLQKVKEAAKKLKS